MIAVKNVGYGYKGLTGSFRLGPVSVEIPAGKMVFWIGHIGSGKTTLARILCGEITADEGQVEGIKRTAIYHHQSVMDNIFPDLKVTDHFRLLNNNAQRPNTTRARVLAELAELGNKYPDELSGGQLQMVAFGSIILEEHSLYVFDEVFNNLDHRHAVEVLTSIKGILSEQPETHCIIITHDLELVRDSADIVHVFQDGRITCELDRTKLSGDKQRLLNLVWRPSPLP